MDKLGERTKNNKFEYALIQALLDKDTICGFDLIESSIGFDDVCKFFFKTCNSELNYSDNIDFYDLYNYISDNLKSNYIIKDNMVYIMKLLPLQAYKFMIIIEIYDLINTINEIIDMKIKELPFAFYIIDLDTKIPFYFSENFNSFMGISENHENIDLMYYLDRLEYNENREFRETRVSNAIKNEEHYMIKYQILNDSNKYKYLLEIGLPIVDIQHHTNYMVTILIDLSKVEKSKLDEESFVNIDKLSNVYNRNYLDIITKSINEDRFIPLSIIFADIDGLKFVNDGFGHVYGDKLIKDVAQILKNSTRNSDIIIRYGGDEFIIFLPNTDKKECNKVIERIKNNIEGFNNSNQLNPIKISLSIGGHTMDSFESCIEESIEIAEDLMYTEKLNRRKNLQKTYIEAIREVLEYKEPTPYDLSEFFDDLILKLGIKLGWEQDLIDMITTLCSVNDVGKITIDSEILNKPEKLTEEEWEIIKKHPEMGYRIAMASKELSNIADYILYHHERWDGKGYPRGISGESIPLYSRIASIIDAFDSMIKDKPYKKKLTIEQAIEEIRKNSGTQFDPNLVDILIDIIKDDFRI